MKLTILGKYGPYPKRGGATSGYLLEENGKKILLECGSGILSRLFAFVAPEALTAVVLTHLHSDHFSDLGVLNYYLARVGGTLDVYLPDDAARLPSIEMMKSFRFHPVSDGDFVTIGGMKISFFTMNHPVPTLGVRIEGKCVTFCFTGDTNVFPGLERFIRGCDLLLADAGFTDDGWSEAKPHLSARLCGEAARRVGVRCILTHIDPAVDEETLLKEARSVWENCFLAEEYKTYEI